MSDRMAPCRQCGFSAVPLEVYHNATKHFAAHSHQCLRCGFTTETKATWPLAVAEWNRRQAAPPAFLVWSHEHAAWWRSNRAGYTVHVKAAGRYTETVALEICRNARDGWNGNEPPPEIPVREADVLALEKA